MEKPCCVCKVVKPVEDFNKDKCAKDGKCPVCKSCRKTKRKIYYLSNKDDIIKKQKEKRKKVGVMPRF
jgi:hypothetical protein